ncbi:MAG: DUF3365 domain-containing protein [Sulfurimonas sp.]
MISILKSFAIVSISASILLAAPVQKQNKELQEVIQTGKESSKLLLKTLGKNMKAHMKKGGPLDALNFCSNEAYSLTESVNKKLPQGVHVKRVSLKYRSPANQPKADEAKVLQAMESLKDANVVLPKHFVEKVDEKVYKFYKPLVINKGVCLKCHGDVQNKKLKSTIEKRYPNDKATGYKMGDLRGAIVVTIDKSAK